MARQSEPAVREGAGRQGPSELRVAGPSAREPRRACGLVKSGSAACHGSAGRGRPKPLLQSAERLGSFYVRCWARCLFISNMVTRSLPNTARSFSSATISRLFCGSWSLFVLMYSQTLLTTSGRGSGLEPTTAASSLDGCNGLIRAGLTLLPDAPLPALGVLADVLFAVELAFLAEVSFAAVVLGLLLLGIAVLLGLA